MLTAEQFRAAAIELFGSERGWQTKLAAALKTDQSSISRYLTGTVPIPGPVEAAMECWRENKKP